MNPYYTDPSIQIPPLTNGYYDSLQTQADLRLPPASTLLYQKDLHKLTNDKLKQKLFDKQNGFIHDFYGDRFTRPPVTKRHCPSVVHQLLNNNRETNQHDTQQFIKPETTTTYVQNPFEDKMPQPRKLSITTPQRQEKIPSFSDFKKPWNKNVFPSTTSVTTTTNCILQTIPVVTQEPSKSQQATLPASHTNAPISSLYNKQSISHPPSLVIKSQTQQLPNFNTIKNKQSSILPKFNTIKNTPKFKPVTTMSNIKLKRVAKTIFSNQIKTPAPIPITMLTTEKLPDVSAVNELRERLENLKNNIKIEAPQCSCLSSAHIVPESGPYYTHLGCAPSLPALRKMLEERLQLKDDAIRIEKLQYTGKEGKTKHGCPIAKWIIRRSGPQEKVLVLAKHRVGHHCSTAWIVVVSVAWEGVPAETANDLYKTLVYKLTKFGLPTERRCGINDDRTCACQGVNQYSGASFSFGCSWSMYYNGCKFARSKIVRKFRLSDETEEPEVEEKLQSLATNLAPVYKSMAPESYENQVAFEEQGKECRLGWKPGRPWSGVTSCVDFCAHAHKDLHNMNNGCTVVVTLTKHRGFEKPNDEQLHVLPLYVMANTDEYGSAEGQEKKIENGSLEVLNKYPMELRFRTTPLMSCRKRKLAQKKQKEALLNGGLPLDGAPQLVRNGHKPGRPRKNLKRNLFPELQQLNGNMNGQVALNEELTDVKTVEMLKNSAQGIMGKPIVKQEVNEMPSVNQMRFNLNQQMHKNEKGSFSSFQSPLHSLSEVASMNGQDIKKEFVMNNQFEKQEEKQNHSAHFLLTNPAFLTTQTPNYQPNQLPMNHPNSNFSLQSSPTVVINSPINPSSSQNHLNQPMDLTAKQNIPISYSHQPVNYSINQNTSSEFKMPLDKPINGNPLNTEKPNALLNFLPYLKEATKAFTANPQLPTPDIEYTTPPQSPNNYYELFSENEENFLDGSIGGVAIALSHGSVLFECAKHELHATTALKSPNRLEPTRISLVFYQHKNLNVSNHGEQEYEKKKELKNSLEGGSDTIKNKEVEIKPIPQVSVPVKENVTRTTSTFVTVFPFAPLIVTGPYQKWV